MKIAKNYTVKNVFTNYCYRGLRTKNKYFKNLPLKLIFLLLFSTSLCSFSLENKPEDTFKIVPQDSIDNTNFSNLSKTQVVSELDTDKDGVIDILDFDDDNDGILDHYEGFYNLNTLRGKSIVITINGAWVLVYTSVYFEIPLDLKHGDEFWVPFMGDKYVKAVRIRFENTTNGVKFIQTAAKHTIGNDPDLDTNLNYDFDNGGIDSPIALADTDEGYGVASITYLDKIVVPDYLGSLGKVVVGPELDTDNDGLIDSRDTDSDNDGCPDVVEGQNNLAATATLENGSIGGSSDNLGVVVNNNGIPLPLGTVQGNEEVGQYNSKASITSEILTVSLITNKTAKQGENLSIQVNASAVKTNTFNLGVPNYSITYGIDTSDSISYEWYKESDMNTILSTSKNLNINNTDLSNEGNYIVKIKSSGNGCIREESVNVTIEPSEEDVLGIIDNLSGFQNVLVAYPNPSLGDVNLLLQSKVNSNANVVLYDMSGKEVFSLSKKLAVGENKISFNPKVASGVFFLKIMSKEVDFKTTKIVFK